jgi:hypothetical protein
VRINGQLYNIIDTVGFGDSRLEESKVADIIMDFAEKIACSPDSSDKIDAFILVVKASPRLTTIKSDIETMKELFGDHVMKSCVVVIIEQSINGRDDATFNKDVSSMSEILSMIQESKQVSTLGQWYVRWDNLKPRPDQLFQLLNAISNVTPFTRSDLQKSISTIRIMQASLEKMANDVIATKQKQLNSLSKQKTLAAFNFQLQRQQAALRNLSLIESSIAGIHSMNISKIRADVKNIHESALNELNNSYSTKMFEIEKMVQNERSKQINIINSQAQQKLQTNSNPMFRSKVYQAQTTAMSEMDAHMQREKLRLQASLETNRANIRTQYQNQISQIEATQLREYTTNYNESVGKFKASQIDLKLKIQNSEKTIKEVEALDERYYIELTGDSY